MKNAQPPRHAGASLANAPENAGEPVENRSGFLGHPRASESSKLYRKGDHVTAGGPENGLGFRCGHCGESWTISSPAEITSYVAASKVFRARHIECPPKEKP